jgi:hypothetical protein
LWGGGGGGGGLRAVEPGGRRCRVMVEGKNQAAALARWVAEI